MLTFPPLLLFFLFTAFSALALPVKVHTTSQAELEVETIKLGMSNALTGPTSELGKELRKGAIAYFTRLNQHGGINGRQVELLSLDDGYEPEQTVINTKVFIEQGVLALFGYVGTPTSYAILPILKKSKIPYLMPFTGADFLHSPTDSNIFNLRASYYQELRAQIEYLIAVQKYKKIALVIQADEFGLAAQRAVNRILHDKKLKVEITARYKRNSSDMKGVLLKLAAQQIEAVIFVGTYQPFTHLINLAHQQELDLLFTSLSFIGSHNLFSQIPATSKIMLSEVVPDPLQCKWQLCQQFKIDMRNAGYTKLNRVQLEGYLNAFVFSHVAMRCEKALTRQCLLKQLEQFNYQDNNFDISFSKYNHQGLQKVYFSFSSAVKKRH